MDLSMVLIQYNAIAFILICLIFYLIKIKRKIHAYDLLKKFGNYFSLNPNSMESYTTKSYSDKLDLIIRYKKFTRMENIRSANRLMDLSNRLLNFERASNFCSCNFTAISNDIFNSEYKPPRSVVVVEDPTVEREGLLGVTRFRENINSNFPNDTTISSIIPSQTNNIGPALLSALNNVSEEVPRLPPNPIYSLSVYNPINEASGQAALPMLSRVNSAILIPPMVAPLWAVVSVMDFTRLETSILVPTLEAVGDSMFNDDSEEVPRLSPNPTHSLSVYNPVNETSGPAAQPTFSRVNSDILIPPTATSLWARESEIDLTKLGTSNSVPIQEAVRESSEEVLDRLDLSKFVLKNNSTEVFTTESHSNEFDDIFNSSEYNIQTPKRAVEGPTGELEDGVTHFGENDNSNVSTVTTTLSSMPYQINYIDPAQLSAFNDVSEDVPRLPPNPPLSLSVENCGMLDIVRRDISSHRFKLVTLAFGLCLMTKVVMKKFY